MTIEIKVTIPARTLGFFEQVEVGKSIKDDILKALDNAGVPKDKQELEIDFQEELSPIAENFTL